MTTNSNTKIKIRKGIWQTASTEFRQGFLAEEDVPGDVDEGVNQDSGEEGTGFHPGVAVE